MYPPSLGPNPVTFEPLLSIEFLVTGTLPLVILGLWSI